MRLSKVFRIMLDGLNMFEDERKYTVRCIRDEYDSDLDMNGHYLKAGNLYVVTDIDAHAYHAWVYLEDFPGVRFNSVRFERMN